MGRGFNMFKKESIFEIKKVSVVIPAKDEEENIGLMIEEVDSVMKSCAIDFEIIVVDDHSVDLTADIATKKGAKIVFNPKRPGKGNALCAGFKHAVGDVIVMMDADYSHRPEDLPLFLEAIRKGGGIVIGSRIWGGSDEFTRTRAFGNIVMTGIFGFVFHNYLSDLLNGYKAFRREVFDNFKYNSSAFEIEIELVVNALRMGYRVKEVPSHERQRRAGKAKSRVFRHGLKFLTKIISEGFRYHLMSDKNKK